MSGITLYLAEDARSELPVCFVKTKTKKLPPLIFGELTVSLT